MRYWIPPNTGHCWVRRYDMNFFYSIIDLLPFEWAQPGTSLFFKNALLAVILITPLFGLLSTMIVNTRMSFFSESLGHGAFTGMVIGSLAGLVEPLWGAVLFSVVFALLVTITKDRARLSADTIIGVYSAVSIALGLVLATQGSGLSRLSSLLVGDLMSVRPRELFWALLLLVGVVIYWVFASNRLVTLSLHRSIARSRGIRPLASELLFSVVVAIAVTVAIRWVGMLVINALLILPAAVSRNMTGRMSSFTLVSVGLALLCGIAGCILSYYLGCAASALIVLILGVFFGISMLFRHHS